MDLYRAERDTKIRARYLGALERGDYKELPGAVYTKGFLRNYALYLGLDPDDVLLQWRKERGDGKEQAPAIVVPKPIATPRKGLTFSPGIVVAALLTVVVVAFGAYLGIQVLRFSKPPDDRRHPACHERHRRRRIDDQVHAHGRHAARRDHLDRDTRTRSLSSHRDLRRQVVGRCGPASRPQPVRRQRPRPGYRQAFGRHDPPVHHRAVPRHRGTDPDGRPAGRGRLVRERRHPGRGQGDQRPDGGRQRGLGRLLGTSRRRPARRLPLRRPRRPW